MIWKPDLRNKTGIMPQIHNTLTLAPDGQWKRFPALDIKNRLLRKRFFQLAFKETS
jgi:hypothetical protein